MLRKLRLEHGWSQEQLAQLSGLNIRTIQRIESGHNAGLESLKSLAAVFEIDISELTLLQEQPMNQPLITPDNTHDKPATSTPHKTRIRNKVMKLGVRFALIISFLWAINLLTYPAYLWAIFPTLGMLFVLIFIAAGALTPEDPYEQKIIDKLDRSMTGEDTKITK